MSQPAVGARHSCKGKFILHVNFSHANQFKRAKLSPTAPDYTKAVFEGQLLLTILSANLSFQIVEDPEFVKLLQVARPAVEFPTRRHLHHLLNLRYDTTNAGLLSDLGPKAKVSLAVDCW